MRALTIHQPWATLCVIRQPPRDLSERTRHRMHDLGIPQGVAGAERLVEAPRAVKWIIDHPWPAPAALIGQRLAIHASAKRPECCIVGPWTCEPWYDPVRHVDYCACEPFGIDDPCAARSPSTMKLTAENAPPIDLPLGAVVGSAVLTACIPIETPDSESARAERIVWTSGANDLKLSHLDRSLEGTDQHPWITDADIRDQLPFGDFAPGRWAWLLADAAPTWERCPWCHGRATPLVKPGARLCPVCSGAGRCEPIPAKGRQRVWEWVP